MARYSTYSGLLAAVSAAMNASMPMVAKETEEIVKKHVDTDVYAVGSPKVYGRTGDLRNSVTSEVWGGGMSCGALVYNDSGRISSAPPATHMSVVTGASSAGSIAEIVHDGLSGMAFGQGYWMESRPYMDNAKNELRGGLYRFMVIMALRANGLDVK